MTEAQINLLTNLAYFKYLNTDHMIRIGIVSCRDYLYSHVFPAIRDKKKPFVQRQRMEVLPVIGRLPDIYTLTKHGACWLEENLILEREQIRYLVGTRKVATRDYIHRMATIDIHIELKLWLGSVGGELCSVSGYFDKPGSQRNGTPLIINKVELENGRYLLPDLITHLSIDDVDKIIVWEQHNGKDTKKLIGQIENHIEALKGKLVGKKLGINKLNRVGVIFEHKSILLAAAQRLYEAYGDETDLHKCFIFKTNEALEKSDFGSDWLLWNLKTTTLLT